MTDTERPDNGIALRNISGKRCLLVQPIHPSGVDILRQAGLEPVRASAFDMATVASEVGDAVAIISRNAGFTKQAIDAAPDLEVIGVHGAGTDAVDVDYAHQRGILVISTPGTNARSVAEHAIGLLLAAARRVPQADLSVRREEESFRHSVSFRELYGRTLCVVGWGRIGQLTAQIATAGLGMKLVVYAPRTPAEEIARAGGIKVDRLADAVSSADAISLHVPATDETRELIGVDVLSALKPGALLVNTSRSTVIDQPALVDALSDGRISVAALDVFDRESQRGGERLLALPNVIFSPHLGGNTDAALQRTGEEVARRVIGVLDGSIKVDAFGFSTKGKPSANKVTTKS